MMKFSPDREIEEKFKTQHFLCFYFLKNLLFYSVDLLHIMDTV